MIEVKPYRAEDGIFRIKGERGVDFATLNYTPGEQVYGEKLFESEYGELREWSHNKSKLAATLKNNINLKWLKKSTEVLYLGASSGTTVSHVSDIVNDNGLIYAVEFSPTPMRELIKLSKKRPNIIPILADVRNPEEYTHIVNGVDFIFCDVAQPNQAEILINNSHTFLKPDREALIAVKTKSISQKGDPKDVFNSQAMLIKKSGITEIKSMNISRFHKWHWIFLGKLK